MNGSNPEQKSTFWIFNVGHLLTITLLLISVVGLYFKVDSRLTAVELLAAATSIKLERIDDNGTRRSQIGISQETELTRANTNRIAELEKTVAAIAPKIEGMATNIQWLVAQQQAASGQPFKYPPTSRR